MLKAILFDLDGVLADTHDGWHALVNLLLKRHEGKKITIKEFDEHIWNKSSIPDTTRRYFPSIDERTLREGIDEHISILLERTTKNDEDIATVIELAKRFKLAVITNSGRAYAEKLLTHIWMREHIDFVIGSDESQSKPSPAMIKRTLSALRTREDEAVYVGDSESDEQAAKNAGVRFIGFRRAGETSVETLHELLTLQILQS